MLISASDGVGLFASVVGRGDPIVFLHEFSGDLRSWEPQLAAFSRAFRCVSFNARGYPPSQVPQTLDRYSQQRAADDVADVMGALGVSKAHMVGLSMGAFAALHLALRRPKLVASLTLAGCGYGAAPSVHPGYAAAMNREADHAEAIGMAAYAQELAGSAYAQPLAAKNEAGWRRFADELGEHSIRGTALTLRGVLGQRPSLWALERALAALTVPTLLIVGDEDAPCIEPNLFLKRAIPDAALCVLPRSGHLVNLEEPALFNAIVMSFLAAVAAGTWTAWKPAATVNEEEGPDA